jgi:hypothetical protein
VVSPASHKIARVSWYSGYEPEPHAYTPTRLSLALVQLSNWFGLTSVRSARPTTPVIVANNWFGLFPVRSPLLRESRLISSRRATEMFQFTRCPPHGLCVQPWVSRHHSGGVAPFGYSGFFAWMQLPLKVSPVSASFFGFKRQGIHLVLVFPFVLSLFETCLFPLFQLVLCCSLQQN